MESGKIIRVEFTHFAVWACDMSSCPYDYVKITDGDGTALLEESCGYSSHDPSSSSYFLPPVITTKTNTMHVFFHSDGSGTQTGWSLNWIAVTPGWNDFQTHAD